MDIKNVSDAQFALYGRVHKGYNVSEMISVMQEKHLPNDVIYVPGDERLEKLTVFKEMSNGLFGGLPIQAGFCNGHNNKLNAFEYHRCSEINIAVTDMILIVGKQQDISTNFTYNTEKAEIFFVPAGTIVEMYATTLHYAPCGNNGEGFRCVVILLKDTNLELENIPSYSEEDKLLTARNKWLIAHEEAHIDGAFVGLIGKNIEI